MRIGEVIKELEGARGVLGDVLVRVGVVPMTEEGYLKSGARVVEAGRVLLFHGDPIEVWLV